jgi:hypothetical protein
MIPLERRERLAVGLWLAVAVVVWNGLYDELLARSTQTYLFEVAMHQAGMGPAVDLASAMDAAVVHAVWISTLWAGGLLALALLTIHALRRRRTAIA